MSIVLFPKFEVVNSTAMLLDRFPSECTKYWSNVYYAPMEALPDTYDVMCLCANDIGTSISTTVRIYCSLEAYSFRVSFERNKYTIMCMQHSMLIKSLEDEKVVYREEYDDFYRRVNILR